MRAGPFFDLPRDLSRDLSGKIEGPGLSLRGISWHPQIIKISAWSSTKIKQLKINVYLWYTAISKKVVGKAVHATIPKGNMGYNQDTCSWHCSCRTYFCCFPLALANIRPWNFLPFFEKQWTKNHPQYLSRLSRALFSTTFLETAVYHWMLNPS